MGTSPGAEPVQAVRWTDDGLRLLDQRLLPHEERYVVCRTAEETAAAIRDMVVRGAPAIGVAAAYGAVLAVRARQAQDPARWREGFAADLDRLAAARPTAVNLFWALARMRRVAAQADDAEAPARLEAEARAIHEEDVAANRRMGELGAAFIEPGSAVLTHCNTGALATGGHGTALGVIRTAWRQGRIREVFADETRPWLQGARLTAWELVREGIPVRLIADAAAAALLAAGRVRWVVVGADRIAANGDVANKIGTYGLAVLARHHGVRFMVVAPTSTIDPGIADGGAIPIETRAADEVLTAAGRRVAPQGAGAWNPVFDVTPAGLVDVLVTERGALERPDREGIARLLG
ncbi:S-methyl-5-thioribose-1-phosphate isomerase [Inmirania thermothiophila]|uniref:Methylthioribose-1-phosphate isomerase n=1 Tax=Inmirania thermothiophila TaxID=1750597 RepID=A0A3N1Y190_9GAMM|nr:S-methyl-5-thioribose-1-phosphate isomerase [Inmirania thermothiophila]ROR32288.1 methylthioribose-1-phosphate isomerase [Inmirania thermothiophila]